MPCFKQNPLIPLSPPNDGTAFPAALAKSKVLGKMAWPRRADGSQRDQAGGKIGALLSFVFFWGGKKMVEKKMAGKYTKLLCFFVVESWSEVLSTKVYRHYARRKLRRSCCNRPHLGISGHYRNISQCPGKMTCSRHVFCCSKGKRIPFESHLKRVIEGKTGINEKIFKRTTKVESWKDKRHFKRNSRPTEYPRNVFWEWNYLEDS